MRIQLSLNKEKAALLERLMEGTYMTRSAFLVYLMAEEEKRRQEEKNRRQPGRPRKGEANVSTDDEEWPDENQPRTLTVPTHLEDYLLLADRKKKVNAYDIMMLEEKRKHHLAQNA